MEQRKLVFEAFDIDWETDGQKVEIPTTIRVDLTEELSEETLPTWEDCATYIEMLMCDKISDETGWLHNGFSIRTPDGIKKNEEELTFYKNFVQFDKNKP